MVELDPSSGSSCLQQQQEQQQAAGHTMSAAVEPSDGEQVSKLAALMQQWAGLMASLAPGVHPPAVQVHMASQQAHEQVRADVSAQGLRRLTLQQPGAPGAAGMAGVLQQQPVSSAVLCVEICEVVEVKHTCPFDAR
jgi:hypothetical protein